MGTLVEGGGWPVRFLNDLGNDSLAAMVIDSRGNLYVCGRRYYPSLGGGQPNSFTAKIDGNSGAVLWSSFYSLRQSSGFDEARAIAIDEAGNAYVTGTSQEQGSNGLYNLVTIKFPKNLSGIDLDATAAASWIMVFDGGYGDDIGKAIAISRGGYVYVGGYSSGGNTSFDFITLAYNSIGTSSGDTALWSRRVNGPTDSFDSVVAVVTDFNDNLIITGLSKSSTSNDILTIKYSPTGTEIWKKRYNYSTIVVSEVPVGVAVDKSNDVYVAGTAYRGTPKDDILTIKYNGNTGDTIWTSALNGPLVNSVDGASSILVGRDSAVYVSGFTTADSARGYKNFFVAKLNPATGKKIWYDTTNGETNSNDIPTCMAIDHTNSVYLAGKSTGADGTFDVMVQKYIQSGGVIAGQVIDDFDGDTSTTLDQKGLQNWKVTMYTTANAFVDSTRTDEKGFYSFYKLGNNSVTYDVMCDSTFPFSYSAMPGTGGVSQAVLGTRKIRVNVNFSSQQGISVFNNFYNRRDPRYATAPQESLVALKTNKAVKISCTKLPKSKPTWLNVRDTAWVRTDLYNPLNIKLSGLVLGVAQPSTTNGYTILLKKYKIKDANIITTDKAAKTLAKFLPSKNEIESGYWLSVPARARCFDIYNGKPWANENNLGYQKGPQYKKHPNHLVGELIALRINMMASDIGTTPAGFPDLVFMDSTDLSNPFNSFTVWEIANKIDTAMSNCNGNFDYALLDTVARKINTAFQGPVDTISRCPLQLFGIVRLQDVPFLYKPDTLKPRRRYVSNTVIHSSLESYELDQNYPNPFNPSTTIRVSLSSPSLVELTVFNILGQEVKTILKKQFLEEGAYEFQFDGSSYATGVYFYRLTTFSPATEQSVSSIRKMLLLK